MKKAYDRANARLLVPLLESITREIGERLHEIRILQGSLSQMGAEQGASSNFFDLKAELATHRRGVRMAIRELERLGCVLEENEGRVIIPGSDGNLDNGFQWMPGDATLRRVSSGASVS